jgi:uncharacterized membrane protein
LSRSRRNLFLAATAVGVIAAIAAPFGAPGIAAAAPSAAAAAPRSNEVFDGPRVLFVEDFEHDVATAPIMLDQYVGEEGERYTADPAWIDASQCNGIITSATSSNVAACTANADLRNLSDVLGRITGNDPRTNHAVSAWTSSRNLPRNAVQVESRDAFSLGSTGRFVSFGVSAAAGACVGYTHPLLNFLLVDGDTEHPVSDRAIDPCTDPRSQAFTVNGASYRGGEFVSSGGVLFSGDALRWRLRNEQSSYSGNDGAIDRVTIVDSTPTLANAFAGTPIVGDTARMTVSVVNTSERGSKPGWSFAERLPEGLTVASDPKLQTTCTGADTTVEPGAADVSVAGDLAIDAADCTVSFDVRATTAGTYTITGDDVTQHVGVDLPTAASVTFQPERNVLGVSERGVLSGGNGDDIADLGEQIAFVTRVENQGNVAVRALELSGDQGAFSCDVATLAPGASTECSTTPRDVTQADVDSGAIEDTVEVGALSRLGVPVAGTASARVEATESAAAVALVIAPQADGRPGVGDEVQLTATVRNSGNTSVRDVAVTLPGRPEFSVQCDVQSLAPGASVDCEVTGAYTVTQADVDAGSVAFAANVTATDVAGAPVRADARASQDTVVQAPSLSSTLSAALRAEGKSPAPGDVVTRTVQVRNTGNVTLTDVAGTVDGRPDAGIVCPTGPLAPSETTECVVPDHVVTQADIDRGSVTSEAQMQATAPSGQPVRSTDSASVELEQRSALGATLSASLAAPGEAPEVGDHVALGLTVRNTGNSTLNDVAASLDGRDSTISCPTGALAPGAERDCTIEDHDLTQAEIDHGSVDFAVTATASGPGGREATGKDSASVELARTAAVETSATSVLDPTEHEVPLAGDTATVSITVRNTGNVTVTGVRAHVTDRDDLTVSCPTDELAPGDSVTCEVSSVMLTQAEVDAGAVRFPVDVAATGADRQRAEANGVTTLEIVRAPAIRATATAEVDHDGTVHAGDAARVTLTVENTGNVTVRDPSALVTGRDDMTVTCADAELAPGARTECTVATHRLTQQEVDAGKVSFALVASATGSDGTTVTADAEAGTDIEREPGIELTVVAHLAASEHDVPQAGDRVSVAVRTTNTGNVTLSGTHAEIVELADLPVACAPTDTAPGAHEDCTVPEYVLTQADVDHGGVTVAAVVEATAPGGATVSDRDEVTIGLAAASSLDLSGEAVVRDATGAFVAVDRDRALRPGIEVWVRFTVVNTGNLDVRDLRAAAELPAVTVEDTALEPGARTTAVTQRPHVVSAAEAAKGTVVLTNQLTAQVPRADGDTTEAPGAATVGQTRSMRTATAVQPTWVFSNEYRTTLRAEAAPLELAFTGSEVVQVALPSGIVLLLAGLVLLVWIRRRRAEHGRHRA